LAHAAVRGPQVRQQHLTIPRSLRRIEVLGGRADAAGVDATPAAGPADECGQELVALDVDLLPE
jgi:hypothetical protein